MGNYSHLQLRVQVIRSLFDFQILHNISGKHLPASRCVKKSHGAMHWMPEAITAERFHP